jgi:bacterioferritin
MQKGEEPDPRALRMVGLIRRKYKGTLMAAGGFDRESATRWLREGRADLIAFGRKFIANPDLAERLRTGAPLNRDDPTTCYGGGAKGYTDYPSLAQDRGEQPKACVDELAVTQPKGKCIMSTVTTRDAKTKQRSTEGQPEISRDQLATLLNEDLAREYQAIIAYVVYSQVLKGAEFMSIAEQLESHAHEELKHALIISRQIDYLGKMPTVSSKPVRTSQEATEMLRFDLDNENETIRNYRQRVRQCEALGEFAMAEQIRQILVDEQDHQIDLATALGEEVPDLSSR